MSSSSCVGAWILIGTAFMLAGVQSAEVITTPFKVGQAFGLQCRNSTGVWGRGLVCDDAGREISFKFGTDEFMYCGWHLATKEEYAHAARIIKQEEAWNCRVPMSADGAHSFYLPVTIPLWGIVEEGHFHINIHMNWVFHADDGRIIGVTAYPMRDRFQYARQGSKINLHGPVRWFEKHSYKSVNAIHEHDVHTHGVVITPTLTIASYCLLTAVLSVVAFIALYQFRLRPQLIKQLLKSD